MRSEKREGVGVLKSGVSTSYSTPRCHASVMVLRIGREITDMFSDPSPCPLPRGARVYRTVISRPILRRQNLSVYGAPLVSQDRVPTNLGHDP